jgi:hypothetical protein
MYGSTYRRGSSGDCICVPPFMDINNECQCEPPRTFDDQGGCDACGNGFDPINDCGPDSGICPDGGRVPASPGSLECVCDQSAGLVENANDPSAACICKAPLTMNMATGDR